MERAEGGELEERHLQFSPPLSLGAERWAPQPQVLEPGQFGKRRQARKRAAGLREIDVAEGVAGGEVLEAFVAEGGFPEHEALEPRQAREHDGLRIVSHPLLEIEV